MTVRAVRPAPRRRAHARSARRTSSRSHCGRRCADRRRTSPPRRSTWCRARAPPRARRRCAPSACRCRPRLAPSEPTSACSSRPATSPIVRRPMRSSLVIVAGPDAPEPRAPAAARGSRARSRARRRARRRAWRGRSRAWPGTSSRPRRRERHSPASSSTRAPDRRRDLGRRAEHAPRAGDVDERLVDRELLDERRDRREDRHDLVALLDVARHARRHERRLRARLAGPRHRHRGAHAERARFVARRADHAAVAEAADDHRLPAQARDRRAVRPRRRTRRGRRAGSSRRRVPCAAVTDAARARRACRRASCRTRRNGSRPRCPAPNGRATTPASGSPTHGAHDASSAAHSVGGTNAASTTMPSGSSTMHVAVERDREMHLAAHPPAHVGRVRAHLVERTAPLAHAQPGLLFDLAGEAREQIGVVGVDHARRACSSPRCPPRRRLRTSSTPSGVSSNPPATVHSCTATVSRFASRRRGRAGTIAPMSAGWCRRDHAGAPEPAPPRRARRRCSSAIALSGVARRPDRLQPGRDHLPDTPTRAEQLLEQIRGFQAHMPSCAWKELGAALAGTILAAIGAATIAILVLRAQSEWRGHAPRRRV